MLLSEAAAMYLDQRRIEGLSHHTIDSYRYHFGRMVRSMGDVPIEGITLADLRTFLIELNDRKASTMAFRVRLMKVFFRWFYEEGIIKENPARKLKEPKLPQRVPKALTVEDLEVVREACKTTREHALIEFLFATGCRAAETSGVKRSDVDWERKSIIVMGKGSKEREVYFGAKAGIWIRRYLGARKDDCQFLFTTERGEPRRLTPHELWYVVKSIAKRVGMERKLWPHVLRHTLATMLLNQGAPITAVQSILGHESPDTTQIYAHLSGASRQQAYQRYFIQ